MINELIGIWVTDPDDAVTQQMYGNARMDFRENEELIYTLIEDGKERIMFLTYEINGDILITDQLSYPQKVKTEFILDVMNGRLQLFYDDAKSNWVKFI